MAFDDDPVGRVGAAVLDIHHVVWRFVDWCADVKDFVWVAL